ncbi:MAG: SGNH/GDSL hydrolase family protein, partial [Chloroflexota bacterium]
AASLLPQLASGIELASALPTETTIPSASSTPTLMLLQSTAESASSSSAVVTNTPTLRPVMATATQEITPFPEYTDAQYAEITYQEALDLLAETPRYIMPIEHVRLIYARGQMRGLDSSFILSVGDCNTESRWYLESLLDDEPGEEGVDSSFFQTDTVQSTVSYFSQAFGYKGQSVNTGLNAASVMDPFWADVNLCASGLSPLTCDYDNLDPFASLIMFGANDINVLSTAGYERAMRDIIETTLDRDIIPILSTFSVRRVDGVATDAYIAGVRFNAVLVQLAVEYNIPLVNFWGASRNIPGNGIMEDNAHLTVTGFNIRNQMTIEILQELQTQVLTTSTFTTESEDS